MHEGYRFKSSLIFFAFALLYAGVLFNLYCVQVIRNSFYSHLAHKQYTITVTSTPSRAPIFDRNHKPVALNKESLSAFILPNKLTNHSALELFLSNHFPKAHTHLQRNRDKHFMYIKRMLTEDERLLIESSHLEDIRLLQEPQRFYPSESLSALVGITGVDNNGLAGIEQSFNTQLAGIPTTVTLERDARSGHFYFKREEKIAGQAGKSITLTIDSDLQFLTMEELMSTLTEFEAREGGVIIMNPDNGDIINMVSAPGFNPNNLTHTESANMKNRTIADSYEPGSVMKVFAALAALQEGAVQPDELIDCGNTRETIINGIPLTTTIPAGIIPFSQVIEISNNIGIVQVAQRIGKKLYDHYRAVGFGQKTGIPLPGEATGIVSNPRSWSKRSLISLSFGYEITTTLLQLAQAFSIIANGGYAITPRIILENPSHPILPTQQLYSPQAINHIKEILRRTVTHGTAKQAAIDGYTIMAKTGTANIALEGSYSTKKNIYTCAVIVEKDTYKRVIVVYVRESLLPHLYASKVVAPLAERIVKQLLIHDRIV